MNWFNKHYDKVCLLVVLMLLLGSALFLVVRIGKVRQSHTVAVNTLPPGGAKAAGDMDGAPYEKMMDDLTHPYQTTGSNIHMLVSELRVSCTNAACLKTIPFHARACPFCLAKQPTVEDIDTDFDGMPNPFERKYGLNILRNDAEEDRDGDGFTNLEEYRGGTDPSDPAEAPSVVSKLRLRGYTKKSFRYKFLGVTGEGDRKRFQLNLKTLEKTYFVGLGEVVEGFKVVDYRENIIQEGRRKIDQSTLTLRGADETIVLRKGKLTSKYERIAHLISLLNLQKYTGKIDETIRVQEHEYIIINMKPGGILLRGVTKDGKGGEEIRVPRITEEEKLLLRDEDANEGEKVKSVK